MSRHNFQVGFAFLIIPALLALRARAAAEEKAPARLVVETVAGNGRTGDASGEPRDALRSAVDSPFGVQLGPDGSLYITSVGQHRVLRLDQHTRLLTSVAGNGTRGYSGDGGPSTAAQLNEPYEVRFDRAGVMYFVEMQNHLIRRIDRAGTISTLAGTPGAGFAGDGQAVTAAKFRQPHSIACDDRGFVYVADIGNHRIRRIDLNAGTITSIAGNGQLALPVDGTIAQGRPMLGPRALFITGRTMWIALREGNSVWRLDLDSLQLRHVAGSGKPGYSGDGGSATDATFNGPKGIAATPEGLVYIVDSENQVIRVIDSMANRIYTVAGRGPQARGFGGDAGPALAAQFDRPHGIALAAGGGLYVSDTNNHRVRWLHP